MKKPLQPKINSKRADVISSWMILALPLILFLIACDPNDGDEIPQDLKISLQPRDTEIEQNGVVRLTASSNPRTNAALTYKWSMSGKYGSINDDPNHYQFEEQTSQGSSSVEYVANPIGNPGGEDRVIVEIFNSLGTLLDVDTTHVTVKRHEPQIVHGVNYEYITEGSMPGRINILFVSAFIFEIVPGFTHYKMTVKEPAGEGWSTGPPGTSFVHSIRGALVDQEQLIKGYGSDIFGLGKTKYALIGAGPSYGNFDGSDSRQVQNLERMRQHAANRIIAVYSVEPAI
ncbi:hypothetical protein [Pleomorphovibrio marinus]|uniref:hypothetical protein n=1 Tax=Pleomorphovibrio marinus TaxID=2164132 RepID=UPI001300A7E9|nr:hypothetical protein [Pleomorphovibrio marinus]